MQNHRGRLLLRMIHTLNRGNCESARASGEIPGCFFFGLGENEKWCGAFQVRKTTENLPFQHIQDGNNHKMRENAGVLEYIATCQNRLFWSI